MRRSVWMGLLALTSLGASPCSGDKEEDEVVEDRNIELPSSVFSRETAVALRTTGMSLQTTAANRELNAFVNAEASFLDYFIMRGGLPEGEVVADIAGTAVQQALYLQQNGQVPEEEALDACGNPQLAAFVSPDMAPYIFPDNTPDEIMGTAIWSETCGGDITCPTTSEGVWQVGAGQDRFDGALDVSVGMYQDGATGSPAYQGHLIGYFLTDNHPGFTVVPSFLLAKQISGAAMGMAKFAKPWTSPSPPTLGVPQEVYVFPFTAREVDAGDLIVAAQTVSDCGDWWDEHYEGDDPWGCGSKALMIDRTAARGASLYDQYSAEGTDSAKVDQVWDTFMYQLKTAALCPDVSEPSWTRRGSIELFKCPDGDVDTCIAYQDREDTPCFLTTNPGTELETDEAFLVNTTDEPFVFPQDEGTERKDDPIVFHTFSYKIDGTEYVLEIEFDELLDTEEPDPELTLAELITELTALEAARSGGNPLVQFVEGEAGSAEEGKLVINALDDLGPLDELEIGDGDANDNIGFAPGQKSSSTVPEAPLSFDPYTVLPAVHDPVGIAYVRITILNAEAALYTESPDTVLGLLSASGSQVSLPDEEPDSHCPDTGPVKFEFTDLSAGTYYLKLDLSEPYWFMITDTPLYVQ